MTSRPTLKPVLVARGVALAVTVGAVCSTLNGCESKGSDGRQSPDGAVSAPSAPAPARAADAAAPGPVADAAPVTPPAPDADADAADPALDPDAAPPAPDPTEALFALDHVLEVVVDLPASDWEALRGQGRTGLDTRGADCMDAPWPSPYTWFTGSVTLDGAPFAQVGVRKKGFFGSLSGRKPSLVLDLDRELTDQRHASLTRFALNNGRQDPSLVHTCLAYEIMASAGVPAPRCHFAHVTVNGEDLGVYAHVESIRKPFLRRHFPDDSGHLYEGTLGDFRPGFSGTIEQKTDEDTPHRAPIDALIAAVQAPDETLLEALGAVLDLEAFYRFWAAEVLVAHWDGYAGNTNNYWLYEDPSQGGRVVFLPWGPDATFEGNRLFFEGAEAPAAVMATGVLTRRLYLHPEGRRRYLETLGAMVETFDAAAWQARASEMAAVFLPRMPGDRRRAVFEAVEAVKGFIGAQPARIGAELSAGGPPWDLPPRPSFCTVPAGRLTGDTETTWGSWPAQDTFRTGTGHLSGTYRDQALQVTSVGGAAGPSGNGEVLLLVPAALLGGALVFVYVLLDPSQVAPGEIAIEDTLDCSFNAFDPNTGESTWLAACLDGTLTLDAAGFGPAEPWRARFELGLWVPAP
jgi:hypothetical protein